MSGEHVRWMARSSDMPTARAKVTLNAPLEKEAASMELMHIDENGCGHPRYVSLSRTQLWALATAALTLLREGDEK